MARPYCQFSAQRVAAPWCSTSHDDVAVPASARARRRSSAASMYAAGMLLAGLPALFSVANLLGSTAAPPAGGHPEVGLGFLGPAASSSSGAARSSSRSLSDNGLPGGELLSPAGATSLASSGVAGAIIAAGLATAAVVTALRRSTSRRSSVMIMRAGKEISEFSEGEVVEGKVARKADIGIWIDIGAIKDALLPKDSMDEKFFDSIRVGDPITVKITKAQDGDTAEDRKILVAYEVGVEEGDKVTAIVDNTAAFGVFVTFDGKKGLVPIRFTKKDDISEYSTGEELELTVVSVEANRVTLSETGATTSRPRSQAPKVGERIKGKVKTVAEFGVFVTTNTPFDCLLPGSQLAKELDEYEEDDEIEFDVLNVGPSPDGKGFRVSGTDRLADKQFSDFQVNQVVKGTVSSLQTFGAFIDVGAPRDALLTAREIEEEGLDLQIDQELDVTVVSVTAKGILVSSRGPAAAVNIGDEVEVKITRVAAFGIFVSGGSGSDYLAPNRFLMKRAVEYVVGETLVVEVIQIEGGRVTVKEVGRVAATVEEGTTFAEVTIRRADVGSGLIVDLGNGFDARIPLQALPKPITEYSAGETLPDVMITRVLDDITLARLDDSPPFSLLEFSDLSMGMKVSGKVVKAETWGVYVDIGAIRAAYLDVEDGVDLTATYTIGQEIENLRISGCNPQAQELSVTTGKIVTDFAQGDEVKATVKRVTPNALIVGIEGLGRDAIAPRSLLKQDLSEYSEGDKFECQVARIDPLQNSMAVSTKPVTKRMKVIFESLADVRPLLNEEVDGVILNKAPFGIFVDIGLKGMDVLAPNPLLGTNKTKNDYEVGQEVKVWIAEVDLRRTRVSVSMEAPEEGGFRTGRGRGDEEDGGKGGGKGGQRGDEDFRVAGSIWRTGARAGQMTRYVKIMLTDKNEFTGISKQEEAPKSEEDKEREKKVAINDGKEESPFGRILDLAEAYPGIVNVHDFMLPPETRASKGGGYKRDAMGYSTVMDIEVPEHLQKVTEDSEESSRMPWKKVELVEKGGRRVMETHYRDILQGDNIGWEKKIKPEIHIKYRSPPLNHPEFIELPEFIPEGALEAMGVKPQTAKIHITPPGGDEPEEAAEEPAEEGEAESPAEEQPEP